MKEERLEELLDDARRTWPLPPDADYDGMWSAIERESFGRRQAARAPSWRVFGAGLAAALALGVGLGRFSRPAAEPPALTSLATVDSASPSGAYDRVASELLGRTVVLLNALPVDGSILVSGDRFASQATELLTSTRLLLDSPAAADARFKDLLEDLELVLAQVAMLQSGRTRQDLDLITDALEERDVVPRIRSAVARLSADD